MSAPENAKSSYRFDVFISYGEEDRGWVRDWLVPRLEQAGLHVCFDHDIGVPKLENIERAIAGSRHTLLILTPAWLDSDWKRFESLLVQNSDPAGRYQRTLPLLLTACDPPNYLSPLTAADFTRPEEWESQLQRVIRAIQDIRYLPEIGLPLFLLSPIAESLLAAMPLKRVPAVAPLPPASRMDRVPNPQFVGRNVDLKRLARALKHADTDHPVVITGIGGMGKTHLAIEFVRHYGRYFAGGVFWLNFSDPNSIPSQIAECGGPEAMNLPGFDQLKLEAQRAWVIQEWQKPIPRLLVIDNCEDDKLLTNHEYLPRLSGSRLLVTSRRQKWHHLGAVELALEVLPRKKSVALLRTFRPDIPGNDQALDLIAAELGDLPLALELAGSYLESYNRIKTPSEYLDELRSLPLHRSLEHGVKNTFILSFRQVEVDPLAKALLLRVARFARGERIPYNLLIATLELDRDDPIVSERAEDALNLLVKLGLLKEESDQTFRMHRLLAVYAREQDPDSQA